MSQRSRHGHGRSEVWGRALFNKAFVRERRRLGLRLRELRKSRGWSQDRAAEEIGIHPVHLQRLESGLANVTLATLVAITLAYRTLLGRLFSGGTSARRSSSSASAKR